MSRAPAKPRAQKASAAQGIADAPKRMPSKRAPKRAVAVTAGVADVAPAYSQRVTDDEMRQLTNDPNISPDGRVWAAERLIERAKRRAPVIKPSEKTLDDVKLAHERLVEADSRKVTHKQVREAQLALHEAYEKLDHGGLPDPDCRKRQDMWTTCIVAAVVVGVIAVIAGYMFLWGPR